MENKESLRRWSQMPERTIDKGAPPRKWDQGLIKKHLHSQGGSLKIQDFRIVTDQCLLCVSHASLITFKMGVLIVIILPLSNQYINCA